MYDTNERCAYIGNGCLDNGTTQSPQLRAKCQLMFCRRRGGAQSGHLPWHHSCPVREFLLSSLINNNATITKDAAHIIRSTTAAVFTSVAHPEQSIRQTSQCLLT